MAKTKVVALSHIPAKLPIPFTCAAWLMLDRLHASGAWHGAVWTYIGLVWLATVISMLNQESLEPKWEQK